MEATFNLLTGNTNNDIAAYYISKAKQTVKSYTKRKDTFIENDLSNYVIDLAVSYYNRKNFEGIQSHSTNGVSETYVLDIPQDIKTALNHYKYFTQEV